MEPFKLFFLDSVLLRERDGFLFLVDKAKALAIGMVFVLMGGAGLLFAPDHGFGFPALFVIYGVLHFPLALRYRAFLSGISRSLEIRTLREKRLIPPGEIEFFFLDSLKGSFFLGCQLKDKKRYLFAAFRPPRGEVTAYEVLTELERLRIPVRDETSWEVLMADTGLRDKFYRLSRRKILLKSCFREMPKDFLVISGVFLLFSLFIALILPPQAPWPVRVGFPAFALLIAIFVFLSLGKDAFASWQIENLGSHFLIKKSLFGRFPVSQRRLAKHEILRALPRPYVYRPNRYGNFTKGLTFRLITKQGPISLGALLSREDVGKLAAFFGKPRD